MAGIHGILSAMMFQPYDKKRCYSGLLNLTLPVLMIWGLSFNATALGDWEERFAKPPADSRILKIIHNWPDSSDAQDQLIRRLGVQGFGGVVCNVWFDQYLESEPKWTAFVRAVQEAKKAGFALWLYDERGY